MASKKSFPYIAQGKGARRTFTVLNACINAGVPFGWVGNPGGGKTSTVQALADATGRELINLSLSTMPPDDVPGLPFPTKIEVGQEGNKHTVDAVVYAMPKWQQRLLNNPHSILFLDEFSTAIPSTQHAFLQLVQDRRLPGSDEPFSDDVAIIIAMNPADQAGGSALDLPIANRFSWYVFNMDFEDWSEGFKKNWKSDTPMPLPGAVDMTDEQIAGRSKDVRYLIDQYLRSSKGSRQTDIIPTGAESPTSSIIRKDDPAAMEVFRLAYPTKRSWDNLARILTYVDPKDTGSIEEMINGTIGSAQGVVFYQYYLDNIKGIDIDRILKDPKSQDWLSMTVDDSVGIFQGLIDIAKHGRVSEVLDVYIAIKEAGADELLSGNRIQDVFKASYMKGKSPKEIAAIQKKYLDNFGEFLKKVNKN